jgi:hypothetical protein
MPVNEAHRPYLTFMRSLSRDSHGREVLVGLNYEETEWYFAVLENEFGTDKPRPHKTHAESKTDQTRYLELHYRHEPVRIQIVTAEIDARYKI